MSEKRFLPLVSLLAFIMDSQSIKKKKVKQSEAWSHTYFSHWHTPQLWDCEKQMVTTAQISATKRVQRVRDKWWSAGNWNKLLPVNWVQSDGCTSYSGPPISTVFPPCLRIYQLASFRQISTNWLLLEVSDRAQSATPQVPGRESSLWQCPFQSRLVQSVRKTMRKSSAPHPKQH